MELGKRVDQALAQALAPLASGQERMTTSLDKMRDACLVPPKGGTSPKGGVSPKGGTSPDGGTSPGGGSDLEEGVTKVFVKSPAEAIEAIAALAGTGMAFLATSLLGTTAAILLAVQVTTWTTRLLLWSSGGLLYMTLVRVARRTTSTGQLQNGVRLVIYASSVFSIPASLLFLAMVWKNLLRGQDLYLKPRPLRRLFAGAEGLIIRLDQSPLLQSDGTVFANYLTYFFVTSAAAVFARYLARAVQGRLPWPQLFRLFVTLNLFILVISLMRYWVLTDPMPPKETSKAASLEKVL